MEGEAAAALEALHLTRGERQADEMRTQATIEKVHKLAEASIRAIRSEYDDKMRAVKDEVDDMSAREKRELQLSHEQTLEQAAEASARIKSLEVPERWGSLVLRDKVALCQVE